MKHHRDFDKASSVSHHLFGDYALIIDEALAGDSRLKDRVAQADAFNRGGLSVLKNALKNRGVVLVGKLADILRSCELDQAHWEERQKDFANIEVRGRSFRARVMIDDNVFRRNFPTLRDAQVWRDRMLILSSE